MSFNQSGNFSTDDVVESGKEAAADQLISLYVLYSTLLMFVVALLMARIADKRNKYLVW